MARIRSHSSGRVVDRGFNHVDDGVADQVVELAERGQSLFDHLLGDALVGDVAGQPRDAEPSIGGVGRPGPITPATTSHHRRPDPPDANPPF
jgi:hypothetical protein